MFTGRLLTDNARCLVIIMSHDHLSANSISSRFSLYSADFLYILGTLPSVKTGVSFECNNRLSLVICSNKFCLPRKSYSIYSRSTPSYSPIKARSLKFRVIVSCLAPPLYRTSPSSLCASGTIASDGPYSPSSSHTRVPQSTMKYCILRSIQTLWYTSNIKIMYSRYRFMLQVSSDSTPAPPSCSSESSSAPLSVPA